MKIDAAQKRVEPLNMDETEKDFLEISIKFRKTVCASSLAVKKMVKATLRNELSHVSENGARLLHGKA